MRLTSAALVLAISLSPLVASAHPGGLNAAGCHNNRRTGDYHCHRGGSARGDASAPGFAPRAAAWRRGGDRAFANCAAARAAGAAPVRRGEPGYAAHLDRDNDGVGCE